MTIYQRLSCRCLDCGRYVTVPESHFAGSGEDTRVVKQDMCPCGGAVAVDAAYHPDHRFATSFGRPEPEYKPYQKLEVVKAKTSETLPAQYITLPAVPDLGKKIDQLAAGKVNGHNGHSNGHAHASIEDRSPVATLRAADGWPHCETCGDRRVFVIAARSGTVREVPCPDCATITGRAS